MKIDLKNSIYKTINIKSGNLAEELHCRTNMTESAYTTLDDFHFELYKLEVNFKNIIKIHLINDKNN